MKTHAELLKEEIMERYNLREDQVRLELSISTTELDLGQNILNDFDKTLSMREYLPEGADCDSVYGEQINQVWVHRKDGFYGTYANDKEDDSDE